MCDPWCNANFQRVPAWVRMGQSQSEPATGCLMTEQASPRVQDPVRMFLPSFLPALAQPERGSSPPSSSTCVFLLPLPSFAHIFPPRFDILSIFLGPSPTASPGKPLQLPMGGKGEEVFLTPCSPFVPSHNIGHGIESPAFRAHLRKVQTQDLGAARGGGGISIVSPPTSHPQWKVLHAK